MMWLSLIWDKKLGNRPQLQKNIQIDMHAELWVANVRKMRILFASNVAQVL
jgi:hypothetical protein